MRWDILNLGRKRALEQAELRVLELKEQNYEEMDLSELIYHWASMSTQVPATVESLLSLNNFRFVMKKSRMVLRERVIDKAKAALSGVYGDNFDLQVIEPLGKVLWKHGATTDEKRNEYMINYFGISADTDY